jgi:hypothetical protein
MVGKTYDAGKNSPSQRADRIGIDTVAWKALVKPEDFCDVPVQEDPWKEAVVPVSCETTIACFLRAAADTNGVAVNDFYKGTGVLKQRYSQLFCEGSRLRPKLLQKLARSNLLTEKQRVELLALCSTPDCRSQLIAKLKAQNFPSKPEADLDKEIRAAGQITPAGFRKIKDGCLCGFSTALKLCFALHCSVKQSEELLAVYGFHWREVWNKDFSPNNGKTVRFMQFLRERLKEKCYDLQDVLDCYWEAMRDKKEKAA